MGVPCGTPRRNIALVAPDDPQFQDTLVLWQPPTAQPAVASAPSAPGVVRWYPPSPQVCHPVGRNNCAVVGATVGSLALTISLLPLFGLISWLLAPLGLLISAVGLVVGLVRRTGRVGAIWGLGTSLAALVVCIGWVLLLLV